METIRFTAEIIRHNEDTYEAICAATPGCRGTGPTPRSALHALRKTMRDFLEPALRRCSQVRISFLVVASGAGGSPPSQRKAGAMPGGWVERSG